MTERFDNKQPVSPSELPENYEAGAENTDLYWKTQKENIHNLFKILGKENEWSDNIEELLPFIRRAWIGKEHGSKGKEVYTQEQAEAILPVLERMGLTGEIVPPPGYVDQVLILGGKIVALDKRMALAAWLRKHGIIAGSVVILAGQRLLEPEDEGSRADLISPNGRFSGEVYSDDPWASRVEDRALPLTEYDLARLMMLEKFGKAAVVGATLELHDATGMTEQEVQEMFLRMYGENVSPRVEKDVYFDVRLPGEGSGESQRFVIVNGRLVARKQGEPRPTTLSTALEWVERTAPKRLAEGKKSKVAVLSGNPSTYRSTEEIQLVLDAAGRDDIELIEAGTAVTPGQALKTLYAALGEVGRRLDNEHMAAVNNQTDDLVRIHRAQAELMRRIAA